MQNSKPIFIIYSINYFGPPTSNVMIAMEIVVQIVSLGVETGQRIVGDSDDVAYSVGTREDKEVDNGEGTMARSID